MSVNAPTPPQGAPARYKTIRYNVEAWLGQIRSFQKWIDRAWSAKAEGPDNLGRGRLMSCGNSEISYKRHKWSEGSAWSTKGPGAWRVSDIMARRFAQREVAKETPWKTTGMNLSALRNWYDATTRKLSRYTRSKWCITLGNPRMACDIPGNGELLRSLPVQA